MPTPARNSERAPDNASLESQSGGPQAARLDRDAPRMFVLGAEKFPKINDPGLAEFDAAVRGQWVGSKAFEPGERESFNRLMTEGRLKYLALSGSELLLLYRDQSICFGEAHLNKTVLGEIRLPLDPKRVREREGEGPVSLIQHQEKLYVVNGNHRVYRVISDLKPGNTVYTLCYTDPQAFYEFTGVLPSFMNRSFEHRWTTRPKVDSAGPRRTGY